MQVEVTNLWLQNEDKRAVAKVRFHDEVNSPHNGATVDVFIPMGGSIDDMKKAALEKAREFLREALAEGVTVIN